jgi:hypothetical protein
VKRLCNGKVVREWSDGILQARDLPRRNAESPTNDGRGLVVAQLWQCEGGAVASGQ